MGDRVTFSRSLYEPAAVQAAAEAYAGFARIVVTPNGNDVVADFIEVTHPLPELVDAFCNHALFETILKARRSVA